jgi:hypothetical protein
MGRRFGVALLQFVAAAALAAEPDLGALHSSRAFPRGLATRHNHWLRMACSTS